MLSQFIKKEILDSLLNQRFMALAIFSVVLMPFSAFINYEYYETRRAAFDSEYAAYEQNDNRWDQRAYRAPVLLSALARGTEPYMPLYFAFRNDAAATSPGNIEAQDFSTLSTFGRFDFLFLVQVVFSLLAVLLAFDMVAGEKERGTLRAVLANRVPRDSILIGKFVGGFSVLWLVFVMGFLLLYLVLLVQDGRFAEPDAILRMLFMLGASTVFLAGFYSLGLMVSALCHSTQTAIVSLLIVWVVLQLVVPKAGELIANVALPLRSQEALRIEKEEVIDELDEEMQTRGGSLYTQITGRPDFEGAFQLLASDAAEALRFREQYQQIAGEYEQQKRDRVREIDQAYQREKARQRQVSRAIALLSPAAALTFFVTDAAGTGDVAYQKYRDAVQSHHQILDREIYAKQRTRRYQLRKEGRSISSSFPGGESPDYDSIPAFEVTSPSLAEIINMNRWALGTLLGYLVGPFILAYVAFLRYDVR